MLREEISKEIKDLIVSLYLSGKSAIECTKLFGLPRWICHAELKTRNIKLRLKRKHKLDESFFDNIDTEEKAYWLGFITADGNVYKNDIQINLGYKDRNHLIKFIKSIKTESFIKDGINKIKGKIHKKSSVKIHSKKIVNSLNNLGITAKKSLIVRPCEYIPNSLIRHYWRGLIDGDGCICLDKKCWRINLVGSEFIVNGFNKWVSSFVESKANCIKQKNIWGIKYSGNNLAPKIMKELYGDASIFLDRKKELADLAVSEFN